MAAQIRSKQQFFDLWRAGVLGNRPAVFESPEVAYASGEPYIGFREVGKGGGGAWELVPRAAIDIVAARWRAAGRRFMCDGAAPNDRTTLQGEVCRTVYGLEGFLAVRTGLSMRAAMQAGLLLPYRGVTVRALMTQFMDPASCDDVDALFDLYPDATIEFSCFDVDVGIIPGRNCIIWEVRDY